MNSREGARFYYDGTTIDGYYAIKDRDSDEYIWVDCTKSQLFIFIAALNDNELRNKESK